MGRVQEFKALPMTPEENKALAESALIMKYAADDDKLEKQGDNLLIGERAFNIPRLIHPVRYSDDTRSLWGTFNVIQEKMTKGGRFEQDMNDPYKRKKARAITGICENVRVNRGLWHLTQEMAKIKTAQA